MLVRLMLRIASRRVASRRRGIDNFSRNLETIGLRHHWLGG
jgi:hypothetical protein